MDDMKDEVFPPLPPPTSPGQGAHGSFDNEDGDADASQLADVPAAKRKGVKRPQPKLDSQRLISERGLPALRTLFDDVRFKGKGHEPEDLRLLMQKMENWAHRLYPKRQFEDFIDKVEKLGTKKDVQTCLKRIRMDMPLTHEDFMGDEEEAAAPESRAFGDPDPFNSSSFIDLPAPGRSTPAPGRSTPAPDRSTPAPCRSPLAPPSLTEEQQQRMEMNRQRALERRLTRQQQTDSQTADSSSFVSPADSQDPEEALDPEPASSTQQQQQQQPEEEPQQQPEQEEEPGQLPHTDPEPLRDEEEEPFLRGESEDGDQRSESGS